MNQPKIMGIPYDPILEPERRIVAFLSELDKSMKLSAASPDFLRGIEHAQHIAAIWFDDEIKVLKLRQQ